MIGRIRHQPRNLLGHRLLTITRTPINLRGALPITRGRPVIEVITRRHPMRIDRPRQRRALGRHTRRPTSSRRRRHKRLINPKLRINKAAEKDPRPRPHGSDRSCPAPTPTPTRSPKHHPHQKKTGTRRHPARRPSGHRPSSSRTPHTASPRGLLFGLTVPCNRALRGVIADANGVPTTSGGAVNVVNETGCPGDRARRVGAHDPEVIGRVRTQTRHRRRGRDRATATPGSRHPGSATQSSNRCCTQSDRSTRHPQGRSCPPTPPNAPPPTTRPGHHRRTLKRAVTHNKRTRSIRQIHLPRTTDRHHPRPNHQPPHAHQTHTPRQPRRHRDA